MNRIEFLANLDKYKGEDHSTFLEHYGILGQKWGQRRWQNADGTFNTEGKIRYFGSEGNKEEKIGHTMRDYKTGKEVNEMIDVKPNHANIKTNIETSFTIPDKYKGYEKEITEQVSKMMTDSLKDVSADKMPKKIDVNITDDGRIRLDFGYDDEPKIGKFTLLPTPSSKTFDWGINNYRKSNEWESTKRTRQAFADSIKKNRDMFDAKNLTDEEIDDIVMNKMPAASSETMATDFNLQSLRYQMEKALNTKFGSQDNQKVGAAGIYDIAAAIISVNQAINNYDDVQRLRKSYGELMDTSDKNYTSDERLSVMTNKKKIALMQTALATGDEKTYNRLLKKVKDKDKEAVEKFLKDLNEKNNAQKMPEDTQKKIEDSIEKMGSLSKPKINKKYLNEDGTLNEAGKQKASHGRKASDVSSSIFLALRNFNLFELASLPIAGTVLALSGFGVPAVLATALAGAIIAPGTAIDHALYKKLEKRADAYYEMLK